MSESLPPDEEIQYAVYPRRSGIPINGSADKLQALYDGYYGINLAFLLNVAIVIVVPSVAAAYWETGVILGLVGFGFLLIGVITYPFTKKIAYGKGWSEGAGVFAAVLLALNSICFCGVVGYLTMQLIAAGEIQAYGISRGLLGFKRTDVVLRIQELRNQQTTPPPF